MQGLSSAGSISVTSDQPALKKEEEGWWIMTDDAAPAERLSDTATLLAWAREEKLLPGDLVFDPRRDEWVQARYLPALKPLFDPHGQSQPSTYGSTRRTLYGIFSGLLGLPVLIGGFAERSWEMGAAGALMTALGVWTLYRLWIQRS